MEGPALEVDGRRIDAAHYLVATGSVPHVPAIAGLRDSGYLTSTTAMELDHRPASMIVVGGGYVALEQAQLFAHLGTSVTMLVRSQLARREEPEIAVGSVTHSEPRASPSSKASRSRECKATPARSS